MSKWIIAGDLHYGEKNNSESFNEEVTKFLEHIIEYAHEHGIKKVCQVGDYFHERHKVNVSTLNHGVNGAKLLRDGFGKDNAYVLVGNHDLYYKDRLDVTSLISISDYVTVVDKLITVGQVLMTPWIISDQHWDEVVNAAKTHKFLFAHLELKDFKMNEHYIMEHGQSHRELRGYEKVVTGHYHTTQEKDNITYTGTPYPISMNEANQKHYFFVLDEDAGTLEKIEYDRIKVISLPYDRIDELVNYDPKLTSVRIEFPSELEDESIISEVTKKVGEMNFTEMKVKYEGSTAKRILDVDIGDISEVGDIDELVIKTIRASTAVVGIDAGMLEEIYTESMTDKDIV